MELFDILLLLFFIILPLIGAGGKKRGRNKPESGQSDDSSRRPPGRDRVPGRATGPDARADTESGREVSAADMVPDDLWAVLTGESPGKRQPDPRSTQDPDTLEPAAEQSDKGTFGSADWSGVEDPPAGRTEPRGVEDAPGASAADVEDESEWGPALPDPQETEVVSLEQRPLPPEVKRKLALAGAPAPPGPAYRRSGRTRRSAAMKRLGLGNRSELRKAVVLREVLGPPKGLQ